MQILHLARFAAILFLIQQPLQTPLPLIRESATVKVSRHDLVIPDGNVGAVPNVGIVGSRAILVIDTGLGRRNGQTVLSEAGKVSRNANLYSVATHFLRNSSPAFPAGAAMPARLRVLPATRQSRLPHLGSDIF